MSTQWNNSLTLRNPAHTHIHTPPPHLAAVNFIYPHPLLVLLYLVAIEVPKPALCMFELSQSPA